APGTFPALTHASIIESAFASRACSTRVESSAAAGEGVAGSETTTGCMRAGEACFVALPQAARRAMVAVDAYLLVLRRVMHSPRLLPRHPCGSGDPCYTTRTWIPASAGMTPGLSPLPRG